LIFPKRHYFKERNHMKRIISIFVLTIACLYLQIFGQAITGRVVSTAAAAVPDANVALKVRNLSTTTNASGQFTLDLSSGALPRSLAGGITSKMRFNGNALLFTTIASERIAVELFSINGRKLVTLIDRVLGPGTKEVPVVSWLQKNSAQGLTIMKIIKGNEHYTLSFISTGSTVSMVSGNRVSLKGAARDMQPSAVGGEILKVSKSGYVPRTLDITAYTAQNLSDIVLMTVSQDSAFIEAKVDSLLKLMNNTQKAAQMVQAMNSSITPDNVKSYGFGSVFNGGEEPVLPNTVANWASRLDALQDGALGSPLKIPMIYGLDAVHGNGKVVGSTIFPHNIGLGCTGDTALVEQVGRVTAYECRALGIHLTFAPCVSVVRDERWGRTYEGFGETPEINSKMGAAFVRGLQGDGDMSRPSAIAGNVKHYLGDGGTAGGVNGGNTTLSEATMRAIHFPPYAACAKEKMASIMPSYNSWSRNGQAIEETLDSVAINRMLKRELNWDGFVLTDYDAIPQAFGVTDYTPQNVCTAVMAGVDMAMIPGAVSKCQNFISAIQTGLSSNLLTQARLDDAVRRILRIKLRLNLWDHPKSQSAMMSRIGSADHRAVAREAVRKSLVLLKNDAVNGAKALPLKTTDKVVVVGPWANKMGAQCGGWTIGWQGDVNYTVTSVGGGQTILQGLQQAGGSNVTSDEQGNNLTAADKIVVVVGENPYAEGNGDNNNPTLAGCPNAALIDKCYNTGKPVIVVMISGRPLLIADKLSKCSAFVAAWLPGTEGGGVADVLYGNYSFTGKLTHTWPASLGQIPINTGTVYSDDPKGSGGTPQFEYGYGLAY
jgi:beta-glucosidase